MAIIFFLDKSLICVIFHKKTRQDILSFQFQKTEKHERGDEEGAHHFFIFKILKKGR